MIQVFSFPSATPCIFLKTNFSTLLNKGSYRRWFLHLFCFCFLSGACLPSKLLLKVSFILGQFSANQDKKKSSVKRSKGVVKYISNASQNISNRADNCKQKCAIILIWTNNLRSVFLWACIVFFKVKKLSTAGRVCLPSWETSFSSIQTILHHKTGILIFIYKCFGVGCS